MAAGAGLLIVIVVCLSPSGTSAVNPGFKGRVTQSGLNYLRDVGLQILKEEIDNLPVPDLSGSAKIGWLGYISYTVSNIRITNFAIPSSTITTRDGVGLVVRANRLSLSVSGNWYYTNHGWIRIRDSGTFDGSMSGSFLALTLRIGKDRAGRPTVESTSRDCTVDAGSVSVKLRGGASWLYNLFSRRINSAIESAINRKACSQIIHGVNTDLQNQFSRLLTQTPIEPYAVVDYSLVDPPTFSGHVDTSHKGEVFSKRIRTEAPYTPPVIPPDSDSSRHVFLWLTDYLIETAGYVYYQAGLFVHTVTPDELPPGLYRDNFNTSAVMMRFIVPEVSKKYPNMLMQVDARAVAPPTVSIDEVHFNATVKVDLDFFATLPNKARAYLFTLNVTVNGSTELAYTGSSMTWNTDALRVDVGLKRTTVGVFNLQFISRAVGSLSNHFLLPWINREGENGLPLPPSSPNIKLVKPIISQGKGFIKLGADVVFTPTAEIA